MPDKKQKQILLLFAVVFLIFITGCSNMSLKKGGPETDSSLLNVKERGKLVVGSDIPWEPMEFFDASGKAAGLDIDIAGEIASKLGVSLEVRDIPWDDLFAAVKSGDVDIAMSGITITPERSEEMLFSNPYFDAGQVIIVTSSNTEIKNLSDLRNKRIGAQVNTTSNQEALKYTDPSLVKTYESFEYSEDMKEGIIYDLKNRKIDAVIIDYVPASELVKKNPILKIAGDPFTEEYYGIVTKKDNYALMYEINRILREMKNNGKLEELKNKWLS
jgi:polar amino acid transport system substrate-binding protein